jgi:hypothetical protein
LLHHPEIVKPILKREGVIEKPVIKTFIVTSAEKKRTQNTECCKGKNEENAQWADKTSDKSVQHESAFSLIEISFFLL